MSFWDINELIDIQPSKGGMYIYSSSEAFSEEQRFDIKRLGQWLHHFGLSAVGVPNAETGKVAKGERGFHSSGHASASELLDIIETINPNIVIPIHTDNPQLFAAKIGSQCKVIMPRAGIPIEL